MQKSEAKMIENFKNKFGSPSKNGNIAMLGKPDKVIIVFGDRTFKTYKSISFCIKMYDFI